MKDIDIFLGFCGKTIQDSTFKAGYVYIRTQGGALQSSAFVKQIQLFHTVLAVFCRSSCGPQSLSFDRGPQ